MAEASNTSPATQDVLSPPLVTPAHESPLRGADWQWVPAAPLTASTGDWVEVCEVEAGLLYRLLPLPTAASFSLPRDTQSRGAGPGPRGPTASEVRAASCLFSFLATLDHPAGQWPPKEHLGYLEKVSVQRKHVTEELILVTAGQTRGRERQVARLSGSGICTVARGSAGRRCAYSSGEVRGDGLGANVTQVMPPAHCPHLEAVTHGEGTHHVPLESQRKRQNSPVPGLYYGTAATHVERPLGPRP